MRRRVMAIVAATVALVACEGQPPPPVPRPTPSAPASPSPDVSPSPTQASATWLSKIRMVDSRVGWATTDGRTRGIARTVNGGLTWTIVSPRGLDVPEGTEFWDADHAWAAFQARGQFAEHSAVYRTSDGGRTWKPTAIDTTSPGFFSFVSLTRGWAMSDLGAAAGSEAITIETTVDGGARWQRVYKTATDESGSPSDRDPHGIGFGGDKVGINFRDASTGWLTVLDANGGRLNVTTDGGRNWSEADLPYVRGYTVLAAPLTFPDGRGVLPIATARMEPHREAGVEVTVDNGNRWSLEPTVLTTGQSDPFFVTSQTGFLAAGEHNRLYITVNGGRTWKALTVRAVDGAGAVEWPAPTELDFITATQGWSLGSGANPAHPDPSLFQTRDAGRTWARVHYVVMDDGT